MVVFCATREKLMLKIGDHTLKHGLVMAPLSGITNILFRLYAKRLGAELVFTEMVSSNGLVRRQKRTLRYIRIAEEERPVAVQIFGSDPSTMAEAARMVEEAGADILDINMGCPVKKVVRTGAGAGLLRNLSLARKIIQGVRKAVNLPVTVKTRPGWSKDEMALKELVSDLEEMGVEAIWVHGRFAKEGFAGDVRWDILKEIQSYTHIPIIPNGSILTAKQAVELKHQGWEALMIGRGFLRDPNIFLKTKALLEQRELEQREETIPKKTAILEAIQWAINTSSGYLQGEEIARFMRSTLLRAVKGFEGAKEFRRSLLAEKSQDPRALFKMLMEAIFYED